MGLKFRYLQHYRYRYGNPWVYVRRNRRKIRIKETIGSPGFARAYSDANRQAPLRVVGVKKGDKNAVRCFLV
jgi:hypothetical protein